MSAPIGPDVNCSDPWRIDAGDFPRFENAPEKWRFLLGYAVLAPSSHNTQPWLFHPRGAELDVLADRTRACRVVDPEDRELIISCGCALFHLRCAMARFGCLGEISVLPEPHNPDVLARVRLGEGLDDSPEARSLFEAMPLRRTNRQPFSGDPIPPRLLDALTAAAGEEACWLEIVAGQEQRHALAQLIAEGDRRQWADKPFRLELAEWVHSNRSSARDGIPGYAQGIDDLMSCAGPAMIRTFNLGGGQAAKDYALATGSPALAVLGTEGDTPREWLGAGMALARILLRARADGVSASFLNQAIELPDLRWRLCQSLGLRGHPQICLRLGYGPAIKPTPRRPVDAVLV